MARLYTEVGQQNRTKRASTARSMRKSAPTPDGPCTLRLDHRTLVTVSNARALRYWLKRYPNAVRL